LTPRDSLAAGLTPQLSANELPAIGSLDGTDSKKGPSVSRVPSSAIAGSSGGDGLTIGEVGVGRTESSARSPSAEDFDNAAFALRAAQRCSAPSFANRDAGKHSSYTLIVDALVLIKCDVVIGWLYRVYRSSAYRTFMYAALLLLMLLVFVEPPPHEHDEGPVWATTADVTYSYSHAHTLSLSIISINNQWFGLVK
jgi:hypothetical protein